MNEGLEDEKAIEWKSEKVMNQQSRSACDREKKSVQGRKLPPSKRGGKTSATTVRPIAGSSGRGVPL